MLGKQVLIGISASLELQASCVDDGSGLELLIQNYFKGWRHRFSWFLAFMYPPYCTVDGTRQCCLFPCFGFFDLLAVCWWCYFLPDILEIKEHFRGWSYGKLSAKLIIKSFLFRIITEIPTKYQRLMLDTWMKVVSHTKGRKAKVWIVTDDKMLTLY